MVKLYSTPSQNEKAASKFLGWARKTKNPTKRGFFARKAMEFSNGADKQRQGWNKDTKRFH